MVRSRFHGLIEPDWRSFFVVVPVEPSPEEIPEAEEYGIVDTITPATTASTTIEVIVTIQNRNRNIFVALKLKMCEI